MKRIGLVLLFLGLGFFPQLMLAQVFLTAQIDSSQCVPVTTSRATGTLWAVLNPATSTLTYHVTYANLDSPFTAAHFHLGAPGVNGGVVEPITFTGNTAQGQWTNIPDTLIDYLMTGKIYVNIHSRKYPAGEIRGQLQLASDVGFSMSLDGSQAGLSVPGTGTGYAVFDPDSLKFIYRVTIAGLTSQLVAAHFHLGGLGANGPVLSPISFNDNDSTATGTWYLPGSLVTALVFDPIYINVHTSENPGGEIRGQLILEPSTSVPFTAALDGTQSVPPAVTQATATAWGILYLSPDSPGLPSNITAPALAYRVTYANLDSTFTASHFHLGAEGVNGGVVEPISFTGNTAQGYWQNIPDSLVADLFTGNIYINIHSKKYPAGEIRGQMETTNGTCFSISLDGSQDLPPISTTGTGTGWAVLDTTGSNLKYQITVAGLSTPLTAAHFHLGAAGINGGVIEPINYTDSTTSATWSSIPDTMISYLLDGMIYANFHTTNHPAGEIRGQLLENTGLVTAVNEPQQSVPQRFELSQNYPNPFNPSTIISYTLPQKAQISLEVFNILGEKIATLVSGIQQAGTHNIKFNGTKFSSGVYFYKLTADGENIQTKKMVLVK